MLKEANLTAIRPAYILQTTIMIPNTNTLLSITSIIYRPINTPLQLPPHINITTTLLKLIQRLLLPLTHHLRLKMLSNLNLTIRQIAPEASLLIVLTVDRSWDILTANWVLIILRANMKAMVQVEAIRIH